MSIELAEKLKQKLTDKWVVVDPAAPELKRFAQWTGKVRTVNMNGRALVEFDGPVDIGWYDIDPAFLTVVDGPKPKAPPAPAKKEAAPAAKPAAAAAAKPAGGSPLDAIRAAGAAKPAAAAAPAAGEKKLSPIEIMRAQQAAKAAVAAGGAPAAPLEAVASAEAPTPAPVEAPAKPAVPTTGPDGKKLSPLEMARLQGAAKKTS